jgi:hypothetical protein
MSLTSLSDSDLGSHSHPDRHLDMDSHLDIAPRALPSPHPPWGAPRGQSIGVGHRSKAGNSGLWTSESVVDNHLPVGGLCASEEMP